MTRRRSSAARLRGLMATVVVAVAAVVGLPAVTWATGPGSQCMVTPAGDTPAAEPVDCEPAPETGADHEDMSTVTGTPAPTSADEPPPAVEDDVPEPEPPAVSELSLSATASPATVVPGETVTFVLTIHNAGPADDPGVTVVGAIPAGAQVQGYVEGLDVSSGSISLGAMAVGDSRTVEIVVGLPPSPGEVITTPQVSGQHFEALSVEHQDTVVVAVVPITELPAVADEAVPPAPPTSSPHTVAPTEDDAAAAGATDGSADGAFEGAFEGGASEQAPGDEPLGDSDRPDSTLNEATSQGPARSTGPQGFPVPVPAPVPVGDDAGGSPAEPLRPPSDPTDSTLTSAAGAAGSLSLRAPLWVVGMTLLAVGGVLVGVGSGSGRIRRR